MSISNLTLEQGLTIGEGITISLGSSGGGGGYSTTNVTYTFGSVSGSTVSDSSGSGKNGTIVTSTGSASTGTDSHGAYIHLLNSAYIDVVGVNLNNSFTISMVASIDSTQVKYWASLWGNETWTTGAGLVAYLSAVDNLDVTAGGHIGGNQNINVGSYTLSDVAQWDFVFNFTAGFTLTVYRNGSAILATTSFSPPAGGISMNDLYIGSRHASDGTGSLDTINMKLYKFNLFNTALDNATVGGNYTNNRVTFNF